MTLEQYERLALCVVGVGVVGWMVGGLVSIALALAGIEGGPLLVRP